MDNLYRRHKTPQRIIFQTAWSALTYVSSYTHEMDNSDKIPWGHAVPWTHLQLPHQYIIISNTTTQWHNCIEKKKLLGLSPRANYTDRAAAAGRRS
jgi:hypothetical protein